ncbi:MAG: ATP-dependent helicase [FCB group bacterium]|nr:ATP-dependent helicase [FCB group bacterium]
MLYARGKFTANQAQTEAITHPPAPLMILAGAGTGKTTTLLHRIIYLIEHNRVDPASLLAITYTENAARELKERLIREIGPAAETITAGTFHSFCYQVVKDFSPSNAVSPMLMEEGDAIYMLMDRFDELGPFESSLFAQDPIKAVSKGFIPFFNRIRDELIDPAQLPDIKPDTDEMSADIIAQLNDLKRIFPIFQRWKEEQHLVDFGDMIFQCHALMKNQPSLLKSLRNKYRHIIVDEFQDNNYALNEIIGMIAREHGSITVVGDDDQVIYSFRGASAYNLQDFRKRYGHFRDYREITLAENYRSHQRILDVANAVIHCNRERKIKDLRAAETYPNAAKPSLLYGTKDEQIRALPEIIRELVITDHFNYNDIAILCRTRNQVKMVAEHLQACHIPTQVFTINYFEIPVIRNLIAWCQVIGNGRYSDSAFFRLLATEVSDETAHRLYREYHKRDKTLRLELIMNDSSWTKYPESALIEKLLNKIRYLRKLRTKKNAEEMVWEICEYIGLFRPLIKRYEWMDQVAIVNLSDFLQKAMDFTRRHREHNTLHQFANYIATLQYTQTVAPKLPVIKRKKPAVFVETVHGAKGAEFPVVIIPFNRSQSFPLSYRPSVMLDRPPVQWLKYIHATELSPKEHHLQEERRLFYVAVTRAQDRLFLLAPKRATSPFIKEIPTQLVEVLEMNPPEIPEDTPTFSTLRNRYEQRLTDALANNQFAKVHDFVKIIERINDLELGKDIAWGNQPWETELKEALKKPHRPDSPETLTLSASAIDTYQQCPLKYRLGYIDKVPELASKPQLVFGTIIHQVLEQFHKPGEPQTEKHLLELLDHYWQEGEFEYTAREIEFKKQGIDLLKRYYRFLKEHPVTVVERELTFSFDLEDINIRGKIDRIDKGIRGYRVVDYKTSKTPTDPRKNLQLAIYSIFLEKRSDLEFGGLPESAALLFLREEEDPLRSHTFTPEELALFREEIRAVGRGIRKQEFDPCKGFHCDWCDYKHLLCPAWEET